MIIHIYNILESIIISYYYCFEKTKNCCTAYNTGNDVIEKTPACQT